MPRMCLWFWLVLLFCTSATRGIILPPELRRIMAGVDSLDSFMKAMNLGNLTLGLPPSGPNLQVQTVSSNSGLLDKKFKVRHSLKSVPVGRTRVVSFSDSMKPPIVLDNMMCRPYPTVVEIPQPLHHQGIHYPFHVMLHRCAGSCNTKPVVQKCVATESENISALIFLVAWNSPSDSKNQWHQGHRIVPLLNHTKCGCKCITKASECNPATQVFVEDNCRCECRAKSRPCPVYHRWDRVRCKCVCDPPSYINCPRRFQWSPEKCKCVCRTTKCRADKIRNQRNCRCYCPKTPLCPKGFRKSRRTCKCVLDA